MRHRGKVRLGVPALVADGGVRATKQETPEKEGKGKGRKTTIQRRGGWNAEVGSAYHWKRRDIREREVRNTLVTWRERSCVVLAPTQRATTPSWDGDQQRSGCDVRTQQGLGSGAGRPGHCRITLNPTGKFSNKASSASANCRVARGGLQANPAELCSTPMGSQTISPLHPGTAGIGITLAARAIFRHLGTAWS